MDPKTGNAIVDGVVQIVVATVNKNGMPNENVPTFMKQVADQLVDCVKEAAAALSQARPSVASAAPVASTAPAAAEATAAPQAVASAPTEEAPKRRGRKPASATAAETASEAVSEETAEVVSEAASEAVAEEAPEEAAEQRYKFEHISRTPVVDPKKSVMDDAIICLIDGEKRKMLTRHLRSKYGMSDKEYREHFNLPADYPMTAPGYSKEKSLIAHAQGLGTSRLYEKAKSKQATPAKVTKRQRNKAPAAASA